MRSALAAALLLGPLAAAAQTPDSRTEREGRLLGVVSEFGTKRPLAGARIDLTFPDGNDAGTRTADQEGRFLFTELSPGRYGMEIRSLGYRTARESLDVPAGSLTVVEAEMALSALELEPIVVITMRRGRLDAGGFERRRSLGFGSFLTGSDIRVSAGRASDLFRGFAGVRVVQGASGGELRMRGDCRPDIVIGGMRVRPIGSLSIDNYVQPSEIAGIEIYRGAQAPPEYSDNPCGALLVWTRPPELTLDQRSLWKRILIAGGLALGSFLLMR